MRGGVLGIELGALASVPAPTSGIQLGTGEGGRPVSLRLFRLAGARVAFATPLLPAQLAVVRAAAAGTAVRIVTDRPQNWAPLVGHDTTLHVVAATELRPGLGGPSLLVDDRPTAGGRGPLELHPWQCRVEVRSQWLPAEVGAFSRSDLTVFGSVPAESTASIATAFAVPPAATEALARLDTGADARSFAVASRGRIEYVTLDPTPPEQRLLDGARVSW